MANIATFPTQPRQVIKKPTDDILQIHTNEAFKATEVKDVAWYDTALTMNRIGLFFLLAGIALAATTTSFGFEAVPLMNKIAMTATASFVAFVIGVVLTNKTYWKDPQVRKEKIGEYFNALRDFGYGHAEHVCKEARAHGLIPKERIKDFIKISEIGHISLWINKLLKDKVFEESELDKIFFNHFSSNHELTFADFYFSHGDGEGAIVGEWAVNWLNRIKTNSDKVDLTFLIARFEQQWKVEMAKDPLKPTLSVYLASKFPGQDLVLELIVTKT